MRWRSLRDVFGSHFPAVKSDDASVGLDQAGHEAQERGLAAAAGADENRGAARPAGRGRSGAGGDAAVGFRDALKFEHEARPFVGEGRRRAYGITCTPFQKATRPAMLLAASFGAG